MWNMWISYVNFFLDVHFTCEIKKYEYIEYSYRRKQYFTPSKLRQSYNPKWEKDENGSTTTLQFIK